MNILIAGASGTIGQVLVNHLKDKHQISVLGRNKTKLLKIFGPSVQQISWDDLPHTKAAAFDSIINLSGQDIATQRWSKKVKTELIQSRVQSTETLIDWLSTQHHRPHFYCANAIGYYGIQDPRDQHAYTEDDKINLLHPKDFLSEICIQWQASLKKAQNLGIPCTITRFAVVLKKEAGMLKKLLPAYHLGLGSIIGHGLQVLSWIHHQDVAAAYDFLLERPHLTGAFNLSAPHPVCQIEFAKILAETLKRPLFLTLPQWLIHLLFGEMGDALLSSGQRVIPQRLLEAGFIFNYPNLQEALNNILQKS